MPNITEQSININDADQVQDNGLFKKVIDNTNKARFYYKHDSFWKKESSLSLIKNLIRGMFVLDCLIWIATFNQDTDDFFGETTAGKWTYLGINMLPLIAAVIVLPIYDKCKALQIQQQTGELIKLNNYIELDLKNHYSSAEALTLDLTDSDLLATLKHKADKYDRKASVKNWQKLPYLAVKIAFLMVYTVVLGLFYETKPGSYFIDKAPDISKVIDIASYAYAFLLGKVFDKCCSRQRTEYTRLPTEAPASYRTFTS